MFESQIPSRERYSPTRLASSVLLHGAALLLALSLRYQAVAPTASSVPTRATLLLAIPRPAPVPAHAARPVTSSPAPQPFARTFTAPRRAHPAAPRPASIEALLPDQTVFTPLPETARVTVALPAPPVVVGKLSSAVSAAPLAESRGLRTTALSAVPAPVPEPEPLRTARAAGFGDASIAPGGAASARARKTPPPEPPTTAIEILAKPTPLYTEEARRLRIEGEVVLQILFTASGEARVERILHGLGHGLDESAAASAASIRFRPALRAGEPVDQTATVHIVFQLAY